MVKEKGFTLIEMLIVLMVISVLLLIMIPNITKHNSMINDKGCQAFVKTVQAQVKAYEIEISVEYTITYINNPESLLIQLSTDRPYGHNAHTAQLYRKSK